MRCERFDVNFLVQKWLRKILSAESESNGKTKGPINYIYPRIFVNLVLLNTCKHLP